MSNIDDKLNYIEINGEIVLILKVKGIIGKDAVEYLENKIERTGFKYLILDDSMELSILDKGKVQMVQNETSRDDTILAKYKADIYEYGSGRTEISYVCDKDNNKECDKKYCSTARCTHTLDKKYAKNFAES